MSHTINVADLADQDAVHRVLSEMKNYGVCYSLIQNEVEVAKIVPVEVKKDETPGEIRKARLEALAGMDELAKKLPLCVLI